MADIYRTLQKHLDKQAVGFPATSSGAEIRFLKRIFAPEEAEMALYLTYRPSTISEIHEKLKAEGISQEDLENSLENMALKGGIGRIVKNNTNYYCTIPYLPGMVEMQANKLTPEFLTDAIDYINDRNFGVSFLSTKVPRMRTIPIEESISVEHHVTTYDNVRELIEGTEGPISIEKCMCRKSANMRGYPCEKTSRLEICMAFEDMARMHIEAGIAREITKEEALEIQKQNQAEGLVLQPSNNKKIDLLCACCGCCCGMLSVLKMLPKPVEFWASNYFSSVNAKECNGCGICVEACQVGAITINEKSGIATVNLNRCIGCGNCVAACPAEAISLVKKEKETVPPADWESLYGYIAENKPGIFGKIKLIFKLLITNRPDLSKAVSWAKKQN